MPTLEGSAAPIVFNGQWYDGAGSRRTEVRVSLSAAGRLSVYDRESGALLQELEAAQVGVSPRLANGPRYLNLPGGQTIESLDNDTLDRWVGGQRGGWLRGWLHRLESNLSFVLVTLVLVVAVGWATVRFGIPVASEAIAQALPAELLDRASAETLQLMEQQWLQPSQLSAERQQALQALFARSAEAFQPLRIRVEFRHSEAFGANAFALPNGQIIFTDAMVELAAHDEELLAIFGHEIGHVAERHSLRRLVQNSLYVFLLALITGDTSGTADLVLGLPVVFAELAYSRAYETEADQFALQFLRERGIAPQRFADLMRRLDADPRVRGTTSADPAAESQGRDWLDYLSTHPPTHERLRAFEP